MADLSTLSEPPLKDGTDPATRLPETPARRSRRLRRMQALLSISLLGVIVLTYVAVSLMAHSRTLHRLLLQRELTAWKNTNGLYSYHPGYIDAEDWLLLDAVPKDHFPRGGVVYIGSSTTQHAVMPWTLPKAQRPYVKDFAVESANYTEQYQWVRFLAKKHQILQTGPRMLVILGLSYFDMRLKLPGTPDVDFIPDLFKRYAWYRYSRRTGIHSVPMNPLTRWWTAERLRDYDFLECALADLRRPTSGWHAAPQYTPAIDQAERRFSRIMFGYGQWRFAMKTELGQLNQMIRFIQASGAHVRLVLLPLASWNYAAQYPAAYAKGLRQICKKRAVPLLDLEHAVADSGFYDAGHLNYTGEMQINPIMLGLAEHHLKRYQLGN